MIIVIPTQDGTWTARDTHSGAFATGATRSGALSELRRLVETMRAAT